MPRESIISPGANQCQGNKPRCPQADGAQAAAPRSKPTRRREFAQAASSGPPKLSEVCLTPTVLVVGVMVQNPVLQEEKRNSHNDDKM